MPDREPQEPSSNQPGHPAPSGQLRLSDKILIAFHQACDQSALDVAAHLLRILETVVGRHDVPPDQDRRRNIESLVAAHERLWHLRNG